MTSVKISFATVLMVCPWFEIWQADGWSVCVTHSLGADGGHKSLNNSSQRSVEQGVSDCGSSSSCAASTERPADSEMCFCLGHWTVNVHNS